MKTRELCRRHNIRTNMYQNTFVYIVFILGLFLIDFATSRLSVDALFSSSALFTNILICLSVCVVFDLTPIGFTPVFVELSTKKIQHLRFGLSIAGFSTVLISLLLFGVLRALTSDLLFDDTALLTDADLATSEGSTAYQTVLILILTLVNVSTSIFSVLLTIERSITDKKIKHAKNCEELDDCYAALAELQQPSTRLACLESEFAAVAAEIDRITEAAIAKAELEIALSMNPRAVSTASKIKRERV